MEKTNKKTLEEIIRVDHAGERGAIKIYEGQLLALKTFKQDEFLKKKIEEMKEHEKEHYEFFDQEIIISASLSGTHSSKSIAAPASSRALASAIIKSCLLVSRP